jgi:hypothetical protein
MCFSRLKNIKSLTYKNSGTLIVILDPSYVPMRFFEAALGRARAIKQIFLPVSHFLHQNETTAG